MKLILQPNIGAEPFLFGEQRSYIRGLISAQPKTKSFEPENDFYKDEGIILGYDSNDQLEFIDVSDKCIVEFQGVQFFSLQLQDCLDQMRQLGYSAPYDAVGAGYDFSSIGLGLYCEERVIKGVSIYALGYYDE